MMQVRAPGRVNLIGDHTDYTGGLVFPMAIDRYTAVTYEHTGDSVHLTSDDEPGVVNFACDDAFDSAIEPRWGRYVAAVASLMTTPQPLHGNITTTIPVGAGLSSSAALEISCALAMGATLAPRDLALMTQRAEQLATGVPTGIMDQLCISLAQEHHAMLIDCSTLEVVHSPIPEACKIVVQFVAPRTLQGSEYGERVRQCNSAESIIGPLRSASIDMLESIEDATISQRARHVINENQRVRDFARALASNDLQHAGQLMNEGHTSLARDFATSTSVMDKAVQEIQNISGVFGARMTGGGFGGCVVALCAHDANVPGWTVSAVGAARLA
jgi:galactokinase